MNATMTKPDFSRVDPELGGRTVLVVGLGRSGLAAARLALGRGARVIVTDHKPVTELGDRPSELLRAGAEVHAGGHAGELVSRADLVVVSPGVPPEIELLERARQRGLPVWGEVELAARFCRGHVVAITGSNGKSTVTSMVGGILRSAGLPGGTGGNLGRPFADLLELDSPSAWHALELSSFQIETLTSLRPDVAVLLNLSPDHLDRYPSVDEYARAKGRLFSLQEPGAEAVLNADDRASDRFRGLVRGRLSEFSLRAEPTRGAFLRQGRLVLRTEHGSEDLLAAHELGVRGEHNVANALAAALAARFAGCSSGVIADGLRTFVSLPHRLEYVSEISGVTFYNDSKATNPDSPAQALTAFEPGRIRLILGGRDKGADWNALVPLIGQRVARVLLVGEAAGDLARRLSGVVPTLDCRTVEQAVSTGFAEAVAGDVVLLSPGCASFDQYRNFEERGSDFRRVVVALAAREHGRG